MVAAGDNGYGVAFPASLNAVISVGGTRLLLGPNNAYGSETAWGPDTVDPNSGTGSGCAAGRFNGSQPVNAQPFQLNVANYANTGCGTLRGDNDVSANADPFSGSAVYASVLRLDQGRRHQPGDAADRRHLCAGGECRVGQVPGLDAVRPGGHERLQRRDQRQRRRRQLADGACNTSTTACTAAPGYDLPTGVGTPHGLAGF